MNIFKFLSKSGKVALSGLQMAGLTAVVGAAGFGAWQYLSGPADDNNAFNPAQYNSEVVYVSNANTGGYNGVPSGADSGPSMQVSAQTLKRLDRQAQAERVAREMEDERFYASGGDGMGAYQMGGTEGLGMGSNYVDNSDSNSSPMGVMQQSMAGMQNMIDKAQQQITGAAGGSTSDGAGGAPALDSVTPNWSRGRNSGAGGSSFAMQNSGKNTRGRRGRNAGAGRAADAQGALSDAQAQAAGMLEGARIRGRSSFGSMETLRGDRDATVMGGGRGRGGRSDLEFIQKRSADAAANRNRSDNEGARAFLASSQISGGMRIAAENVTTGQGQHSRDFDTDSEVQLRSIRTWGEAAMGEEIERNADRNGIIGWLAGAALAAVAAMILISWLMKLAEGGAAWAGVGVVIAIVLVGALFVIAMSKASAYADKWGSDGLSIALQAVAVAMLVGAFASMIFYTAVHEFWLAVAKWLGTTFGGGAAVGAGGTAVGGEIIDSAVNTGASSVTNLPPDNMV